MKTKFEFSNIQNARKKVETLATNVARLEADIVIVERQFEEAQRDDGVSAPEEIYKRSADARKEMEIRRIEANRAAAKLAEAEEECGDLIKTEAPKIIDHLVEASRRKAEEIKQQVIPFFGERALNTFQLNSLISESPAIAEINAVARRIRMGLDAAISNGLPRPDLIRNVLSAEEHL